jgi:hypothetical protein
MGEKNNAGILEMLGGVGILFTEMALRVFRLGKMHPLHTIEKCEKVFYIGLKKKQLG